MMEPNKFYEFLCIIFGHDWNQSGSTIDSETKIVLSSFKQCERCGLRMVDESGYLLKYNLEYGDKQELTI